MKSNLVRNVLSVDCNLIVDTEKKSLSFHASSVMVNFG